MMISRELIVREDGTFVVIEGNPSTGYTAHQVVATFELGQFRRKWQAVEAAHGRNEVPA